MVVIKCLKTKKQLVIIILLSIFLLICFFSIAYSAFFSTMILTGDAYAKIEAYARITDFRLASVNNATSSYEEFGRDYISCNIDLVDSSSSITYYVEITNYGSNDIGIYDITGLPEGISYSIKDYNLKDKICNDSGSCNSFITKTYEITISADNLYNGSIQLNFDFRPFFSITYTNFNNSYLSEFISGDTVSIDLSLDSPPFIYVDGSQKINYSFSNNILTFSGVSCDIEVISSQEYTYSFVNGVQTFVVPVDGIYKVELWGSGGQAASTIASDSVGKGGYTSGLIELKKDTVLYIYVGNNTGDSPYNGGGMGEASGGGATDIRLVDGNYDDFDSLKSRIMVAAGGAGGVLGYWSGSYVSYTCTSNGHAGGLIGYDSNCDVGNAGYGYSGYGATQVKGGNSGKESYAYTYHGSENGSFGIAGRAFDGRSSGGGGGYYGGGHGVHTGGAWSGGGGGSSFISGHNGCDAIDEVSTEESIVHTGQNVHYSGYKFKQTKMIDGQGYEWTTEKSATAAGMPTFDGTSTMLGNSSTGYAKITLLQTGDLYEIKYTNIDGNYKSFIKEGSNLSVTFEPSYYAVKVKNLDGTDYSDYFYNPSTGSLVVYNVNADIEIVAINKFDVVSDVSVNSSSNGIVTDITLSNVSKYSYPITANYYLKLSSEDDSSYELIHMYTFSNDTINYRYEKGDIDGATSYDIKVVLTSADGYTTSILETIDM